MPDHPIQHGLFVGTILSMLDIPIMHTYVDDVVAWIRRTFLDREWRWPVIGGDPESLFADEEPAPPEIAGRVLIGTDGADD